MPVQAIQILSLVREDFTHCVWSKEARLPQLLSLRSRSPEPQQLSLRCNYEARAPRAHALPQEKLLQ